jgi:hypothetical protein
MRIRIAAAVLSAVLVIAVPLAAPAGADSHAWRTTLHYEWNGSQHYGTTAMVLDRDGSFHLQQGGGGTWSMDRSAHRLVLRFSSGCRPAYTGDVQGMQARGTMQCRRGHGRGHWFIDRLRPDRG